MTVTLRKSRTHEPYGVRRLSAPNPPRDDLAPARGFLNGIVLAVLVWVLMLVVGLLVWLR